jgi:hypothetical protein
VERREKRRVESGKREREEWKVEKRAIVHD